MVTRIEKLTPEQEAVCAEVVKEHLSILDKPWPPDLEAIAAWLKVIYADQKLELPEITIVGSPKAALALANELKDPSASKITSLDHSGLADMGWVAYSDAMLRLGAQTAEEAADSMKLKMYYHGIFDSVLMGPGPTSAVGRAILVQHGQYRRDAEGRLHCADGPAVLWTDGEKAFFWHGVRVPEKVVMDPKGYTADEYRGITDTEVRRALGEHAGWAFIAGMLAAATRDTWADEGTGLRYELLRAPSGEQWLSKLSPALQDGSQPVYLEPVHEELKTAQAARKWQATALRPEECETDPELTYGIET